MSRGIEDVLAGVADLALLFRRQTIASFGGQGPGAFSMKGRIMLGKAFCEENCLAASAAHRTGINLGLGFDAHAEIAMRKARELKKHHGLVTLRQQA